MSSKSVGSNEIGGSRFWSGKAMKLSSRDYSVPENPEDGVELEGATSISRGEHSEYRVYKRRWFGLAQLTLMNIMVSWDVSCFKLPWPILIVNRSPFRARDPIVRSLAFPSPVARPAWLDFWLETCTHLTFDR
jgi:hypothetical protein